MDCESSSVNIFHLSRWPFSNIFLLAKVSPLGAILVSFNLTNYCLPVFPARNFLK